MEKVLNRRREIVKIIAEESLLSIDEIADFFQVAEYSIETDLEALGISKNDLPQGKNPVLFNSIVDKRDSFLDMQLQNGVSPDVFLPGLGLYVVPIKERLFICEEEQELFRGASIADIALAQDVTKIRMRKRLRALGIEDPELVIKEGKQFRKQVQLNQLQALISEGVAIKKAASIVNFGEYASSKVHMEVKNEASRFAKDDRPLAYKNAERRNQVYKYYSEGMTKQEIADKMKLCRTTVSTDLKQFIKEHPEMEDKTVLWQQRNLQKDVREVRRSRKDDVIFLRQVGFSPSKVAKIVKLNEGIVRKYLDEEGMLGEYISPRRALVRDLLKQGYSDVIIAQELGYRLADVKKDIADLQKLEQKYGAREVAPDVMGRRAEELRLSWRGVPTTEIMEIMGRNRNGVLRDQHITSNFLRNNEEALQYVTERNGNVFQEIESAR